MFFMTPKVFRSSCGPPYILKLHPNYLKELSNSVISPFILLPTGVKLFPSRHKKKLVFTAFSLILIPCTPFLTLLLSTKDVELNHPPALYRLQTLMDWEPTRFDPGVFDNLFGTVVTYSVTNSCKRTWTKHIVGNCFPRLLEELATAKKALMKFTKKGLTRSFEKKKRQR